jgi:hypothetical protein
MSDGSTGMSDIRGTAWRKELVNTAIVTVEKTNRNLEVILSHLKPLMNTAEKSPKSLMIDILRFSGKARLTPDIVLLKLLSETMAQKQGDIYKPHLFTFTFLRSSFYSVTVKRVSTSTPSDNLPLANFVQAARSFQYLTNSIQSRLQLLKTFKATLDSRLGYTWSASSVWLYHDKVDLPELVDDDAAVQYGIPDEEFQRLRHIIKQEDEPADDIGFYVELRKVFVMLDNALVLIHRKLRKQFRKLYRSITLSNFETVLNQLNHLLLDLTTVWEHRFSTVYSAIYIYHQQPNIHINNNFWLNCVNNLLLEAKKVDVKGVKWGTIIPILYKYVVSYGLAVGLCYEMQKGWLQAYKFRSLIQRLISFSTNKEHQKFLKSVLIQLESLCVGNKKQAKTVSCDETLQTAPLIMNEVAKLFLFLLTLKVPESFPQSTSAGVTIWPLPTVPFNAEELLLSLAELEQVYKGILTVKSLKIQPNVITNKEATPIATTSIETAPSYFQKLQNHVAAHPAAYLTLASLALSTGMLYLWNYEGGEMDYCMHRSRPVNPGDRNKDLHPYFTVIDNLCCAMPNLKICQRM